jgi:hypothetical protein
MQGRSLFRTERSIGVAREQGVRGRSFLRNGARRGRSRTRHARHPVASAADSDAVDVAARGRPMNTTRGAKRPADEPRRAKGVFGDGCGQLATQSPLRSAPPALFSEAPFLQPFSPSPACRQPTALVCQIQTPSVLCSGPPVDPRCRRRSRVRVRACSSQVRQRTRSAAGRHIHRERSTFVRARRRGRRERATLDRIESRGVEAGSDEHRGRESSDGRSTNREVSAAAC